MTTITTSDQMAASHEAVEALVERLIVIYPSLAGCDRKGFQVAACVAQGALAVLLARFGDGSARDVLAGLGAGLGAQAGQDGMEIAFAGLQVLGEGYMSGVADAVRMTTPQGNA